MALAIAASTHKNVTDSRYTPVHRGMSIHHSTMPEFRNASPACARRRQASAKKNAIFDQVIAKYDANADGELDFGECKKLLADMLGGAQPADEEVTFVMRLGGPTAKPQITKKQLPMAFAVMEALKDTRAMIEQLFDKYDMNHDREIQQSELGGLLKELNDGVEPHADEVAAVITKADRDGDGGLTKQELYPAIVAWYSTMPPGSAADPEPEPASAGASAAATDGADASSNAPPAEGTVVKPKEACCTVS